MYKKKLKMNYRLKCKTRNHSRRKDNQYTLTSVLGIFFWNYLSSWGQQQEKKKIGLNPTKKLLPSKSWNHQQSKRQTTAWKKIFSSNISDKGLISNYIKKLYNSISNKQFSVGQNGRAGRHWAHRFPKAHPITTIYGSAIGVNDLKTSRKGFPQLKI